MAIVSLALHYTKLGNDQWGCTQERLMMSGKMNTNVYCTREMAACRFQPGFVTGQDKQNASVACNEAVSPLSSHVAKCFFTNIKADCSQVDANHLTSSRAYCTIHVFPPGLPASNQQGD